MKTAKLNLDYFDQFATARNKKEIWGEWSDEFGDYVRSLDENVWNNIKPHLNLEEPTYHRG